MISCLFESLYSVLAKQNTTLYRVEGLLIIKGSMIPKNERGYRLKAKNKRFLSLLILPRSVMSIKRKLLKTTHTKERSVYTNSESCNIQLGTDRTDRSKKSVVAIKSPYFSP